MGYNFCFHLEHSHQRIILDDDIEERYPRYALYAYGEGFVTEKLRRMHFSGIPVLFIPGNAGSHEQGLHRLIISFIFHSINLHIYF